MWEIDESSGRLFRRTFNTKTDGEVHISCLRCAVCHGKFDDRDFERKENGHEDGCVTDPNGCLIHASCGPKCKYCGDPLYAEKFLFNICNNSINKLLNNLEKFKIYNKNF